MAAPRKWSDEVRAAIHQLINEDGRPATEIGPILKAKGHGNPSVETIRDIARAERKAHADTIDRHPKAEQLRRLLQGLVTATHAEITRVQAESGDDAPDQLLKLARTIREIEPLLSDKPSEKAENTQRGTLGGLASVPTSNDANATDLPASPVTADVAPAA